MTTFTSCLNCGNTDFNRISRYCRKCSGWNVEYPVADWMVFIPGYRQDGGKSHSGRVIQRRGRKVMELGDNAYRVLPITI